MSDSSYLVDIRNLSVDYWQRSKWVNVVSDLCLYIQPAETFGLVGESGSGKTTTANALLGYRPPGCRYTRGKIFFEGQDLLSTPPEELQQIRGRKISFVPQDPTTALSPAMQIGVQLLETLQAHHYYKSEDEARTRILNLFSQVGLPTSIQFYKKYPHQLSGGQQQRVMIAMALACEPQLLVLDEPTTGLDVTTQAQILQLLTELRLSHGMAMFYVTHNLGVVAQICNRIGVMYAGQIVEIAPVRELFREPLHPYTQGLMASVPSLDSSIPKNDVLLKGFLRREELPAGCKLAPRCRFATQRCFDEPQVFTKVDSERWLACWRWEDIPSFSKLTYSTKISHNLASKNNTEVRDVILDVDKLQAAYKFKRKLNSFRKVPQIIVDEVSFQIHKGITFGLVGESGSGKTTVARALSGLLPFVSGEASFAGKNDLTTPLPKRSDDLLRSLQYVFQNPDASLNPRHRISRIIGEPIEKFFRMKGADLRKRVEELLEDVHLDTTYYDRFPDELSGGERQRIAIARALAAKPVLMLCDEILSSLDVSIQANILQLLIDLQNEHRVSYLFISHDLTVIRSLAQSVAVMYRGYICEIGNAREVFSPPYHPYTYMLLSSVPEPDPDFKMLGKIGDSGMGLKESVTSACPLAPRCLWKIGDICESQTPPRQKLSETHRLFCHIPHNALYDLWEKDRTPLQG